MLSHLAASAEGSSPSATGQLTVHWGGLVRCSRSYALNGRMSSILYPWRSRSSLASSTVFMGAPAVTETARRRLTRDAVDFESFRPNAEPRRDAAGATRAEAAARLIVVR